MNKTVTFNLNGMVFTIEEDGYALLKQYLDAVKTYFGRQADGLEIVSEIEARIAEKFRLALDADNRQVLYAADVEQLIAEMGTVNDFEAFEADEQTEGREAPDTAYDQHPHRPARLFRTTYNRILAGVANGLAVYLQVDVSLVRLLFILSTIFLAGFGLILYLVLWIAVPESDETFVGKPLDKEKLRKNARLYRDADEKVLGGVSAGIAAYLNIDPLAVRLLFIIATVWGGFGILAYLLLWIAMPQARTLAQKVEMRGQEANLANMKDAKNPREEEKDKGLMARLLSLPVDLLRLIASAIGVVVNSLAGIFRIVGGVFFIFLSTVVLFGTAAALTVAIAHFTGHLETDEIPIPLEALSGSVGSDVLIMLLSFILVVIPFLLLLYLGVRLLLNRKLFRRPVIITGAGIWAVALLIAFFMGVRTASEFQREGRVTQELVFGLRKGEVPTFRPMEEDENDRYDWIHTEWKANTDDTSVVIRKIFEARGSSAEIARQHATMIEYDIERTDSIWLFGRGIDFKPGARFRGQHIELEILIPKNRPVRIDNRYYWDNEILNYDEILLGPEEVFILTDEGLKCLSCKPRPAEEEEERLPQEPDTPATAPAVL